MDLPPLDFASTRISVSGDPKQLWPREVDDFVPWLVAHVDELGEQLGMRLEVVGTEVPIGGLRADLVVRDAAGRRVIVEAQFGPSDHQHLGQIVTYACAGHADAVVWVVAGNRWRPLIRPEHAVTLAELNRRFSGECEFHGVEASLESETVPFGTPLDQLGPVLPRLRRLQLPA